MAKKEDIRDIEKMARKHGMDEETRRDFGDYVEDCKRSGIAARRMTGATSHGMNWIARPENFWESTDSLNEPRLFMLGMLDICEVREKSADQTSLRALLQMLVGEPFLHLRFSYGDELGLHLGQPREYSSSRMKGSVKGSYILAARASTWSLRSGGPPAVFVDIGEDRPSIPPGFLPLTTQELENKKPIKPGSLVVAAEPIQIGGLGFGCSIVLADGSSLLILPKYSPPSDQEDEELEIADWELFTPFGRYLKVGPGPSWSYLPSRPDSGGDAAPG